MKFSDGPMAGQDIDPAHWDADEIQVSTQDMTEEHQPIEGTAHVWNYRRDSFGRFTWQNPESV